MTKVTSFSSSLLNPNTSSRFSTPSDARPSLVHFGDNDCLYEQKNVKFEGTIYHGLTRLTVSLLMASRASSVLSMATAPSAFPPSSSPASRSSLIGVIFSRGTANITMHKEASVTLKSTAPCTRNRTQRLVTFRKRSWTQTRALQNKASLSFFYTRTDSSKHLSTMRSVCQTKWHGGDRGSDKGESRKQGQAEKRHRNRVV
ncbi:hypothetical protein MLD38_010666 [Melastoma candidum]|uniref:Uncharacterized protein n=1 Tax=Melastoma candidum TaxID=119954 RepID=A0ACB9R0Q0_9MYRT|nr:hypothetical protein MLD38_010666 [Melastoma candidum]